jgi:iron complex transport system permease protein
MARSALPGLGVALAVLAAGLITAFTVGRYPVSLAELIEVLAAHLTGRPSLVSPAVENVILLVRGPRVLAAVMVGAALAVAGTAFQGLFRNPLVSWAPPRARHSARCSASSSQLAWWASRASPSWAGSWRSPPSI